MEDKWKEKFELNKEVTALHISDWKNDPKEFDKLCQFVIQQAVDLLKAETLKPLEEIIPMRQLRNIIRQAALQYKGPHSLPIFLTFWVRELVLRRLRTSEGNSTSPMP